MLRFLSLLTTSLFFAGILFFTPLTAAAADEVDAPQPWQWMLGIHTNYQYTLRHPEATSTPVLYSVQRLTDVQAEGIILLSQQAYLFTPDEPLRTRVYQFIQRRQGWVQHIFEVSPDLSLTQLKQAEHWHPLHGCSVRWEQQEDYFVGENTPRDCYFFVGESGEKVEVASSIKLYPDYFTVTDDLRFETESGSQRDTQNTHTEYHRTTFFDADLRYSAHSNDDWQDVEPTGQLHDQGARVGLTLRGSGLELRYQIELQRTLSQLTFKLHDLSQGEIVHEASFDADVDVVEVNTSRLRIRLKPRP